MPSVLSVQLFSFFSLFCAHSNMKLGSMEISKKLTSWNCNKISRRMRWFLSRALLLCAGVVRAVGTCYDTCCNAPVCNSSRTNIGASSLQLQCPKVSQQNILKTPSLSRSPLPSRRIMIVAIVAAVCRWDAALSTALHGPCICALRCKWHKHVWCVDQKSFLSFFF